VLVLGGMALLQGAWTAEALEEWLAGLATTLGATLVPLLLSLLASLLLGLLSVLVWGWFQGGMLGVLVAAERQAPPGAENRSGAWRWFRTFSLHDFSGWAGRYMWRFFWYFHLSLTVCLLLVLAGSLIVLAASLGYQTWGASAAYGIGCGASLPLLFAGIVYVLWNLVAQPAVALPESGTVAGARVGLRLVGRRPGAVLLLCLAFFVLSLVVGIAVSVMQMAAGLVTPRGTLSWALVYALFSLLQWVASSLLSVYANAAYSSLVVAEAEETPR
jgi:ABC-type amino acid transport system permease subunit